MNRRTMLSGVATAVALAGCTAGGEDDVSDDHEQHADDKGEADAPEPSFEVVEHAFPDEVESGEEWSWSIAVENVGEAAGTFFSHLFVFVPGHDSEHVTDIQLEIEPSATETFYGSDQRSYVTTYEYTFMHANDRVEVVVRPARLTFGDSYRTPTEVVLSVTDLELREEYTYERVMGSERTQPADAGHQWAFVDVTATNEREYSTQLPRRDEISLRANDEEWSHEPLSQKAGNYRSRTVDEGNSRDGWIAYQVPEELTADDLIVAYSAGDSDADWGARWKS